MYKAIFLVFAGLSFLAGCSNTLEATEVGQHKGKTYVVKVSTYSRNALINDTDILLNGKLALRITPKTAIINKDPACSKVPGIDTIITCIYNSTFEGNPLTVRKVIKSSLLTYSENYEIFMSGELLEVVNILNK